MGRQLSARERQTVRRKFAGMLQNGEIGYEDILHRMSHTLRNPEWQNSTLKDAGQSGEIYDPGNTMTLLERAFSHKAALVNRAKSADVLTSLAGSGAPLIRTDLETTITSIFVDEFPGWDRIRKFEANGVAHNYVVSTDFDAADVSFVNELDPATKGQGVYSTQNAPIAIGLTERGASLKELFAVRQSGMSYNGGQDAVDLELERGTLAISYSFQKGLYQATLTAGHTGTDEFGTYYSSGGVATAFQGLRGMLSNLAGFDSYFPGYNRGAGTGKGPIAIDQAGLTLVQAINQATRRIMNNGSRPTAIHMSANAAEQLSREAGALVRIDNRDANGVSLGTAVDSIVTIAGKLPIVVVPGDGIGSYTAGSNSTYNGTAVEDIYVLNERVLGFAYLGAPQMTVIEIPVGVDGTLGKRYLLFGMYGFVNHSPAWNAKIRLPFVA